MEYDPSKQDLLFVQVDEPGLNLFTVTDGRLDIITASWEMWDAIIPHIAKQRAELLAEIAAERKTLSGNTDKSLKKPLLSEINFKDFLGI